MPSLLTLSIVVSEKTDELEVTSQEKNTEYELGSGSENAVGVSLPAEPEDSNLKLEGSFETHNDSNEVCDKPVGKAVHANIEAGMFYFDLTNVTYCG